MTIVRVLRVRVELGPWRLVDRLVLLPLVSGSLLLEVLNAAPFERVPEYRAVSLKLLLTEVSVGGEPPAAVVVKNGIASVLLMLRVRSDEAERREGEVPLMPSVTDAAEMR